MLFFDLFISKQVCLLRNMHFGKVQMISKGLFVHLFFGRIREYLESFRNHLTFSPHQIESKKSKHVKCWSILKGLFLNSFKKWTKNFQVCFLEELKIPKYPFEINLPLDTSATVVIRKKTCLSKIDRSVFMNLKPIPYFVYHLFFI